MRSRFELVDVSSSPAREFVHRSLRSGLSLSRLVDVLHPADCGAVEALVGVGVAVDRARAFEIGGVLPEARPRLVRGRQATPTPSSGQALARLAEEFLRRHTNPLVVVEDAEGYLSTPAGAAVGGVVRKVGGESYAFLTKGDCCEDRIAAVLRVAYTLPFFNTVWASLPESVDTHCADGLLLHACAEHASCVAVGAYDAESYLLWTPSDRDPRC